MRTETDSLGEVTLPDDALWGAQTQRAIDNFRIGQATLPEPFIRTLIHIKRAAAEANGELGELPADMVSAICSACETLLKDEHLMRHFPVHVLQTGSGTSTNMNANEVIANLARSAGTDVHPNDHVNRGQSSNDVIPTCIQASVSIEVGMRLLPAMADLDERLNARAAELADVCKTGRTHLMDAMPVTFGQVLAGYAAQLQICRSQVQSALQQTCQLPQGGTAVGTGVNTHPAFASTFAQHLSKATGCSFEAADNAFALIGSQDASVAMSGACRGLAVTLTKMANDFRWMNSGPLAGLGEITLSALQPGSSIMPGKVNPVIPEAIAMAAAQVIGNDTVITLAGQSGNFELNVMLPLVADNLLRSIELLTDSVVAMSDQVIADFTVNETVVARHLSRNPILVTALNPIIGYEQAAQIAKEAYASGQPILDVASARTQIPREELERLLDPTALARPHE